MSMIIGLDVHSKSTFYFAQDQSGQTVGKGIVSTSLQGFEELLKTVQAPSGTAIGLETGTQMTFVARTLSALGMKPVVLDAREVRAKARRRNQKSDSRDAFEICDGLRRDIFVTEVYVPDPKVHQLRRILSRRRHFVRLCTRQINAAKFILRMEGIKHSVTTLGTQTAWEKMLADPALASICPHLDMHYQVWRLAADHVSTLEEELAEALTPFAQTESLLRTMPGVGRICAATFIATLGIVDRFPGSAQVGSYCGLVPSAYDSGEMTRRGHITKAGSPELRAMLCEVAHNAARGTHPLNPYWRKIMAKGGYRKAIVAVAHRMARILYQMWRKQEAFDVTKLNVICEKVVKKKTYCYRLKTTSPQMITN